MDASGALDSLLGRLTTVLVNETQLLGGVRSDVEFIKDEMESMNGLILHLTEAQHRDHQVQAWMKQVVGLTWDCEGNVELYVHYVGSRPSDDGFLGYLRRVLRFVRTIPVRHRIATRIQELKVRAQDVGDRRQRYGVTVPVSTRIDTNVLDVYPLGGEEDLRRRAVLLDATEPPLNDKEVVRRGIDSLMKWLSWEPAAEDGAPLPQVRVFSILGRRLARKVAEGVYQQHSSVASIFGWKALSDYREEDDVGTVLAKILEQVGGVELEHSQEEDEVANQAAGMTIDERLISKTQGNLKGKRFLIVLHVLVSVSKWKLILDALLQAADGCLSGSAIIMTTEDYELAMSSFPYKIIQAERPRFMKVGFEFYIEKAKGLLDVRPIVRTTEERLAEIHASAQRTKDILGDIFDLFRGNTFAMKTFLHLLYVNPRRTEDELQNYKNAIYECRRLKRSIPKQVLLWCYNELPSKYRSCLLYLTVFPEDHVIRTRSLARRWVSEGLATRTRTDGEIQRSSTDEAEHCLDVLFTRGFVSPLEISPEGDIKSCTLHREARELITMVATDVNFVDSNVPPHLARYLSIHNRIRLQKSHSDGDSKDDIAAYLPSLAASSQWQLLKVLDLEGCKGLKKKHMKSVCKILLLKYLSLRNTDITEIPKQIKELQCLETLDIRQTKVRILAKKAIVLPRLKHFLAGHKVPDSNGTRTSEESVSAVELPLGIQKMKNMEILSGVKVTDSGSEITGISQLMKLQKLGVALHGNSARLSDLFIQIEKLQRCLRGLSIWIDPQASPEDAGSEDALPSLPQFIERLNISGIGNGISSLVQEHHQLTKITLSGTDFKGNDLRVLGTLRELRCLRLQHKSYPDGLVIMEHEFKNLKYLLVKGSWITKICFLESAAPELERIVLSFGRMDAFSGIKYLRELKEVELNGSTLTMRK